MSTSRKIRACLFALLALHPLTSYAGPSFVIFDGKPGSPNDTLTYAYNISHNGRHVAGEGVFHGGPHAEGALASQSPGGWVVRRLGILPSDEPGYSAAYDVTSNAMVVGVANAGSPTLDVPYTFGPPLAPLALFPGDKVGEARGVNVNGSAIVGWGLTERTSRFGATDPFRHALLWSSTSPPVLIDPAGPGAPLETVAMATTNSGNAIVGFGATDASLSHPYDPARDSRGHQAMVWRKLPGGGFHRDLLPFLAGRAPCARAHDVDVEGGRVVGFSGTFGQSRPVLWSLRHPSGDFEILDLGSLGGFDAGGASGISADGKTIVGSCYRVSGTDFESVAFIWDRVHGMRDIRKLLLDAGVREVENWKLVDASAVSQNGEWVCGNARNDDYDYFAWVARMP